jgi:hypothetical protein
MSLMIAPPRTRTRREPRHISAARALSRATRRLVGIITDRVARGHYLCDAWSDADDEASRAEKALLESIRGRGIAGVVVDSRLYLDLNPPAE